MTTRSTDVRGRVGEALIAVEATPGAQADKDLARATTPLKPLLQLHRIVARVKAKHGSALPFLGQPTEECTHLLGGHLVSILGGVDARNVHGSGPALAAEVELGDELICPSGRPRWAGQRSGERGGSRSRARGCTRRRNGAKRSRPRRRRVVHRRPRPPGYGRAGHAGPRRLFGHASKRRRGSAPSATMGRLKAEVDGGRDGVCGEESVREVEEGVGPTVQALVERVAERAKGVKSIGRFHDATRFSRWRRDGTWDRLLSHARTKSRRGGRDRVGGERGLHRDSGAPARRGSPREAEPERRKKGVSHAPDEALWRSRGGLSTKLHLSCDGKGRPLSVVVTPVQRHEIRVARPEGSRGRPRKKRPERLIADKGYSYPSCRALLRRRGIPHTTSPSGVTSARGGRREDREDQRASTRPPTRGATWWRGA